MNRQTTLAARILIFAVVCTAFVAAVLYSGGSPALGSSALAVGTPPTSGPSVGAPVFSASAITMGTSTVIRVSSLITSGTGPAVMANGVNLLQVDGNGDVLATLGVLNDNGVNGDLRAGDQIYSGQFTFSQATAGVIHLQVSAAFERTLKRVHSVISPLEVLPSGTPMILRFFSNSQIVTDVNGRQMPCDQVLAFIKPGTSIASIDSLVSGIGGTVVGFLPGAQLDTWQIQINCSGGQGVQNAVNRLLSSSIVVAAEPNYVVTASGVIPNDPGYKPCKLGTTLPDGQLCDLGSSAPELMQIRVDQAWAITQGLSTTSNLNTAYPGPLIAVVDTGVDNTQEDLAAPGKVIYGMNFVADPVNNNPMDDNGHGTGVAGVAAADGNNGLGIAGVSWASPILAEKVLNQFGTSSIGTISTVAAGISHAVSHGAKIINLSLGNGMNRAPDIEVALAIDAANKAGALVVAGAGNDYCSQVEYPAGFGHQTTFGSTTLNTTVLSVGGLDFQSNVAVDLSVNPGATQCQQESGSNFGPWVDIYAPFNAYTTQSHQCFNCSTGANYAFRSGTSFSTPFVSGVAALVWAANPNMSAGDVMNTLLATADPIGLDPLGNNINQLDAFTAVFQAAAIHCTACPQAPEVSVTRSNIYVGPMVTVGVDGRGPSDLQNESVHGVSVPLTPIVGTTSTGHVTRLIPVGYQFGLVLSPGDLPGGIAYLFNTWDSYQSPGFYDSFSVSTSIAPYWQLGIRGQIQPFSLPSQDPLSPLLAPFPGTDHPCEATAFPATAPVACTFNALFVLGGQNRGPSIQTFQTSLAGLTRSDGSAPVLPGVFYFGGGTPATTTWLNFVLDTASSPNSDNRFPSSGVFHIFDITPLCLNYQNPVALQPSIGPNCAAP